MGNKSSLDDTGIVCNCGHEESEHSFAGFCRAEIQVEDNSLNVMVPQIDIVKCDCDHYSQTKLKKRSDAESNK